MNPKQRETLGRMAEEVRRELTGNILPFWLKTADPDRGGFYGQITGCGELRPDAPRASVLNMRLLWTFAAAYRVLGDPALREAAQRAKQYIERHFMDPQYGGVYWSVDARGEALDTKKQIYSQGFAIYGMSEYYRATGDTSALECAKALFESVEEHAYDGVAGGYWEALGRDWSEIGDVRLSDKDANERKSMNTHLHILEPYTNLYRVWKEPRLAARIRELIEIFCTRIVDPHTGHFNLFFGDDWEVRSSAFSYGHDIEGSWLLHEAALELGDEALLRRVEPVVRRLAEAAAEGLQEDGSIICEHDPKRGTTDRDRHWWPQAESVIGYLNLFQHFGDNEALQRSEAAWRYIDDKIIDHQGGEWFWSIRADGTPNRDDDKAGPWKCSYHNSRMCLEVIERTEKMCGL